MKGEVDRDLIPAVKAGSREPKSSRALYSRAEANFTKMSKNEERFDVVIVETKTRIIEAIIGKNMNERQADKREMTGISRINENYYVDTLPHDPKRKQGDRVPN